MYKATRPDGTDFYSGKIRYSRVGSIVAHPRPGVNHAAEYISVATVPTDCTGFSWPCRLFEVEPVGESWTPEGSLPNKRAAHKVKIIGELDAWKVFGPQGEAVVAIIDKFKELSVADRIALYNARGAGWIKAADKACAVAYGGRAGRAGLYAARLALGHRLGGWGDDGRAAYGAALAVLFSGFPDLALSDDDYETLLAPWVAVTA